MGESEKSAKAGTLQKEPPATGHMTYTQDTAVSVCEENIFHLFLFTQPV